MAKPLSKWEQDSQRRQRSRPQEAAGKSTKWSRKVVGITVLVVIVGLLTWVAWPSSPADTRAENVAAFGLDDDPFLGDADAPVVLVGYESPRCGSCQQFHNSILPGLEQQYFDSGNVVYHYVQGTIGEDFEMSIAQECAYGAGGNDAFWRLTDMFYARPNTYSDADEEGMLRQLASEQGLDTDDLVECLENQTTSSQVSADWRVGSDMGAKFTPTFWAFGPSGEAIPIQGASSIANVLDSLLADLQ